MRHQSEKAIWSGSVPLLPVEIHRTPIGATILNSIAQMIWSADADGRHDFFNRQWYEFTGIPLGSLDDSTWPDLVHPADKARVEQAWVESLAEPAPYELTYRLRHRSGGFRWVLSRGEPVYEDGRIVRWVGSLTDIDAEIKAKEALNESEAHFRDILDSLPQMVWTNREDGSQRYYNRQWYEFTGLPRGSADQVRRSHLVDPDDRDRAMERWDHSIATGEPYECKYRLRHHSGHHRWVLSRGVKALDPRGEVCWYGTTTDIHEHILAEQRVRWSADHDVLTELPNRAVFQRRLDEAIEEARAEGRRIGLLLLDVDDFKQINDTLGHDAGDSLLCTFADRLRDAAEGHFIARLGGDEFAIVIDRVSGREEIRDASDRIVARLREPFVYDGRVLDCRATIGASLYPDTGKHRAELVKQADTALYVCKATTRGQMMLFEPEMRADLQNRAAMLSLARRAIDDRLIVPFYQPKIDLKTGRSAGFEALLRWRHSTRGIQLPSTIAAAFEDLDLAAAISDHIVSRVIRDARRWIAAGVPFGHVAINASAAEFRRGRFAERLLDQLHEAEVPTDCLQLEVTETVFLGRGADYVEQALKLLNAEGVRIALDDFGTGYASLSHLKQFPVNVIKIDQSFVRDLEEDPDDAAIIAAVVHLGQNLGIDVVAEGIETPAQERFLTALGCGYGQGFLYGKAAPASRVPAMLRAWGSHRLGK